MSSELKFVNITRSYLAGVECLFKRVFNHRRSPTHTEHKFFNNPAGDIIAVCAMDGDKVVGFNGLIPCWFKTGEDNILGLNPLMLWSDPDYQRRGLFTKLASRTFEAAYAKKIQFLVGFPNRNSLPGFVKYLNWNNVGDIIYYRRILNAQVVNGIPKGLKTVANMAIMFLPRGKRNQWDVKRVQLNDLNFHELLDDFHQQGDKGVISVDRNADWYEWRYSDNFSANYMGYVAEKDGQIQSVLIYGVKNEYMWVISDILGKSEEAKVAVVSNFLSDAKSEGVDSVRVLCKDPALSEVLAKTGFMKRERTPLTVRPMTHVRLPGNIHSFDSWRVFGGDCDTE